MSLDWPKIILMSISTVAACISVISAIKTRKMQTQLIENKSDIEELSQLIEQIKLAKAINSHPHHFDDDQFELGSDLKDVPAQISKLSQNPLIGSQIKMEEWELPINNFDIKIKKLYTIRKLLF